jgi:hypothetical protein
MKLESANLTDGVKIFTLIANDASCIDRTGICAWFSDEVQLCSNSATACT